MCHHVTIANICAHITSTHTSKTCAASIIAYSDSNLVYSSTLLEHCLQQAHSAVTWCVVTWCVALDMPAAVLGRQVAHKCSYGGTVAI